MAQETVFNIPELAHQIYGSEFSIPRLMASLSTDTRSRTEAHHANIGQSWTDVNRLTRMGLTKYSIDALQPGQAAIRAAKEGSMYYMIRAINAIESIEVRIEILLTILEITKDKQIFIYAFTRPEIRTYISKIKKNQTLKLYGTLNPDTLDALFTMYLSMIRRESSRYSHIGLVLDYDGWVYIIPIYEDKILKSLEIRYINTSTWSPFDEVIDREWRNIPRTTRGILGVIHPYVTGSKIYLGLERKPQLLSIDLYRPNGNRVISYSVVG